MFKKLIFKIKSLILLEVFFFILTSICIALIPYIQKIFIQTFSEGKLTLNVSLMLIVFFVSTVVIYSTSNYLSMRTIFKSSVLFEKSLRDEYMKKIVEDCNYNITENDKSAHIQMLTTEITQLEQDYLRSVMQLLESFLQIVLYFVFILFFINKYIAVGALILSILGAYLSYLYQGNVDVKREEYLTQNKLYIQKIKGIFDNITSIRPLTISKIKENMENETEKVRVKRYSYGKKKSFMLSYNNSISYLMILLFFIYIVILAFNKKISLAVSIISFGYIDIMIEPIISILENRVNLISVKGMKKRIEGFLEGKTKVFHNVNKVKSIELDNVSYSVFNKKILSDFTFEFKEGMRYFINGKNGVGKSTLLKIIANIINGYEGQIKVNGVEINSKVRTIFKDIYYIEQSPTIFAQSFLDNVTMFNSYDIDVLKSFDFWNLEILDRLKKVENCEKMSGGEKQITGICRAIASGATFLLMDESFSGVNKGLENVILDELIQRNYTLIYISHDLKDKSKFENEINM